MTLETSPVLAFRPFSENDWLPFQGAEPFADGSAPKLAELTVDGLGAVAILDRNGLAIVSVEDYLGETFIPAEDDGNGPGGPSDIRRALALLSPEVSSVALESLGFRLGGDGPYSVRLAIASYETARREAERLAVEGPGTYDGRTFARVSV